MHAELTSSARGELLAEYFDAFATARASDGAELATALERVSVAQERYLDSLPSPAFSRCPFTQEPFVHSLDTGGLDGLWWRYENPVRPPGEDIAAPFFALTGAVQLRGQLERTPFLCKPGPEVPFVVPRLLANPAIRAVVSQVSVGAHAAYPVVYFAQDPPEIERFNTWGTDGYDTGSGWDSVVEDAEPLDFELSSWIEREQLLWIAPSDEGLELRRGLDGCPFLDLPGRRNFVRIQGGTVSDGPAPPPPP